MILAGDIGGTKTAVALYERADGELREVAGEVFPSRDHGSLDAIIERFLAGHPDRTVDAACFGVAGAVIDGRAATTNLPWSEVSEAALSRAVAGAPAKLLNDLQAAALGMQVLPESARVALNPQGEARPGNIAVIAAGTGLGEAFLAWDGQRHHALPTEGGHTSFAPRNEEEIELLRFLQRLHGRVSQERVVSGMGLADLYRFVRERSGEPEPAALRERFASGDPGRVVTEAALAGEDAVCERTMALFCSLYGAEAGDLVLKTLAVGGVFVGGGIAPRILPLLQAGGFLASFVDKGRFAELLSRVPVWVVTEPRAPLLGAAHRAAELA
ncbi:MAG: glucokinase [Myxococcota bacterium]